LAGDLKRLGGIIPMKNKPDNWINRKDALSKFLEKEKKRVNDYIDIRAKILPSKDAAGKGKELDVDSEYGNIQQLRYEQRQRIVCGRLLDRLIQFTNNAATFLEGSGDNIGEYSRRYLWRVLLSKASTDLLRIQAAVQQRSPGEEYQLYGEVSRKTLIKADIIAEHALEQAVENGFLVQTPIFTFLKENISIREVPYANVVMIGVALASMDPDPGAPDPGAPDPGAPDPGAPDLGVPDLGVPDLGVPDKKVIPLLKVSSVHEYAAYVHLLNHS